MTRATGLRRRRRKPSLGNRPGKMRPYDLRLEMLESREMPSVNWLDLQLLLAATSAPKAAPTPVPADTAGNTLATTRSLGTLTTALNVQEYVGTKDTDDYYNFTLKQAGRFSAQITGLKAVADLQLIYDANGNKKVDAGDVLATGVGANAATRAIDNVLLQAGTYFARVSCSKGETTYGLQLKADALPGDTAGNTLATAKDLGSLANASLTLSDWLSTLDRDDYYRFQLAKTSDVVIALGNLKADANLQLIRDVNGNQKIDAGDVLAASLNKNTTAESISKRLDAGVYFVQALWQSGETTYSLALGAKEYAAPTPPPTGFLGLKTARLAQLTQSLDVDGSISRADMIAILQAAAGDDKLVDATELADLRTIVSNASTLRMENYVMVLAGDVVNGNPANATYQGATLGNLAAGSSADLLGKLVNKWFLGADHPVTGGYAYRAFAGQLFVGGATYTDIHQGAVGDCYYVASLGAIAKSNPALITGMFIDNGDSTFTVRFYRSTGVADYVTVDRQLPTTSSGSVVFAGVGGGTATSTSNELWVALAEKAYVQWNETGYTGRSTPVNNYSGIAGGWMNDVYQQVMNRTGEFLYNFTTAQKTQVVAALQRNAVVTLGSKSGSPGNGVVGGHAYIVTGYDAATDKFTIYNPWGTNHPVPLTWAQIQQSYVAAAIA